MESDRHVVIIHHSEIALKKGNRPFFEKRLKDNIRLALKDLPDVEVRSSFGRFLILVPKSIKVSILKERLTHVIGIASLKFADKGEHDPHKLKRQIYDSIHHKSFQSFCIDTRRADKEFPYTSVEMNQIIGAYIREKSGVQVDLEHAELVITIEIFNRQIFFTSELIPGERGLPVGSLGKVVSLLSAGIDSPVSSFQMMKRGCRVIFVHFHSFPFTEKTSCYNAIELAKKLTVYQYRSRMFLLPLAEIQQAIILSAPAKLRIVLYRRMMFRLARRVAQKEKAGALVTGESLGQVASQTLENISAISSVVDIPVLRPLIGMEKEQIVNIARRIGTFETSIQPFDDCCSYLIPPKPETKAKIEDVVAAENRLGDWEAMLKRAIEKRELERFHFPKV